MHVLFEHVSIVHALLSLHTAAISAAVLSTLAQPVDGLQLGFLQMSSDVHVAPTSVTSHAPAVALHVCVRHAVLVGHGLVGMSAQYRRGTLTSDALHAACSAVVASATHPATVLTHCGLVQNVALLVHGYSWHAQLADGSDENEHAFEPRTHAATLHCAGLHSELIDACVRFVYTQPTTGSHVSTVQMSVSLHTVVVTSHDPVAGLHMYCVHAVLFGHVTLGVYTHTLLEHESVVHALLSLHSAAIADAFFCRVLQPPTGSQNASAHWSLGVGHTRGV
jgi:hypothetical protein